MEFELGKYYKWIGPKESPEEWNSCGEMDFMLDGAPRKCIKAEGCRAKFDRDDNESCFWTWQHGIENITECSAEGKEGKKMKIERSHYVVVRKECNNIEHDTLLTKDEAARKGEGEGQYIVDIDNGNKYTLKVTKKLVLEKPVAKKKRKKTKK